jgi:predicted DNA-binding protein
MIMDSIRLPIDRQRRLDTLLDNKGYHVGPAVGGGWRSARVGLRAEMGPLRKSMSVRLEEGVYARLRRQSLRSGIPTSALVRALVHRWLDEQDEAGEATTGSPGPEQERQPGLFGEEGGL